ncbi:MAG TPA: TIR domain-containing protein [Ktedonobacterales bacterium]
MSDRVRVFLSHSHADDAFAKKLADDLTHAGADVWVDFADIAYDNFLKKIDEGLRDRQWLVLVMTPTALRSEFVQMEVTAALLQVAKHSMRGVIPILAAPCSDKEIPATWAPLHRYDATRDYQSALAGLINALGLNVQPDNAPKSPVPPVPGATPSGRTLVVDCQGGGDYKTIAEAIKAAQPGDRIEIRAGLYREGKLKITKQLELAGTGATTEDVVVIAQGGIMFEAPRGRLFGLALDGSGCASSDGLNTIYTPILDIQFGRPDIEQRVIANHANADRRDARKNAYGIRVGERAAPFVARCIIRRCNPGIQVAGKAHIEQNEIGDCIDEGINVAGARDVTIRSNRVHNNGCGIWIERGSAVLEQNSVYANRYGVYIGCGRKCPREGEPHQRK